MSDLSYYFIFRINENLGSIKTILEFAYAKLITLISHYTLIHLSVITIVQAIQQRLHPLPSTPTRLLSQYQPPLPARCRPLRPPACQTAPPRTRPAPPQKPSSPRRSRRSTLGTSSSAAENRPTRDCPTVAKAAALRLCLRRRRRIVRRLRRWRGSG